MKLKPIFVTMLIILIIGQVHAAKYTIGITPPKFGMSVLHSGKIEKARDWIESNVTSKKNFGFSLFPMVQVDFVAEFLPYLALETGIGYGMSIFSSSTEENGIEETWKYKKEGIIIPLMVRAQYAFGSIFVYASIGPKFVIPISDYLTIEVNGKKVVDDTISFDKSGFIMDIGFAIGSEIKKGKRYMGLRLGYDLNLISQEHEGHAFGIYRDWYHDNFNVSLTLRYIL